LLAFSDIDQRSADIPNHMLQKSVCANINHSDSKPINHRYSGHISISAGRLTTSSAEGGEIVLTHQALRGPLHCFNI
jgi:hypothetical protein